MSNFSLKEYIKELENNNIIMHDIDIVFSFVEQLSYRDFIMVYKAINNMAVRRMENINWRAEEAVEQLSMLEMRAEDLTSDELFKFNLSHAKRFLNGEVNSYGIERSKWDNERKNSMDN